MKPPLLVCGHFGDTRENLRPGIERWCPVCQAWIPKKDTEGAEPRSIRTDARIIAAVDREAAKIRDDLDAIGLMGFLRENPRAAKFALIVTADCLLKHHRDPSSIDVRLRAWDQLVSETLKTS